MPITLSIVGGWLCAAFVGALGKFVFDKVLTSPCSRRHNVQSVFSQNKAELLRVENGRPVIPFEQMENEIKIALKDDDDGGVLVIGAPVGAGKSTYVNKYLQEMNRPKLVFNSLTVLESKNLHHYLGIPKEDRLSSYIPKGAVIIIDQIDCTQRSLTEEILNYIRELATDGYNFQCYRVVLIVSNPHVMKALLDLNKNQKIKDLCAPRYIKWGEAECKQYINELFPDIDENKLFLACSRSNSPGVIYAAYCDFHRYDLSVDEMVSLTDKRDQEKEKEWQEFDDVFKDHLFYRPYQALDN